MAEVDTLNQAVTKSQDNSVEEFTARASQKVQLDIDDAPFLFVEEEKPQAPAPVSTTLPDLEEKPAENDEELAEKKRRKKRLLIIGGISTAALLLLLALGLWFSNSPPPTPTPTVGGPEPTVIVVPSTKSPTETAFYKIEFAPFMIEQRKGDEINFLQARFAGLSTSEKVIKEAKEKQLILRDSIYYFLRNKPYEQLLDPASAESIKHDLQDIVNGALSQGKLDDILLENYLIK